MPPVSYFVIIAKIAAMALRSQASTGRGPGACNVWEGLGAGAASAVPLPQSASGDRSQGASFSPRGMGASALSLRFL